MKNYDLSLSISRYFYGTDILCYLGICGDTTIKECNNWIKINILSLDLTLAYPDPYKK